MTAIFPVILSGGYDTQLWPLSRLMYPKQFIKFFDGPSSSLLGAALGRLKIDAGFEAPILLCHNDHRFLVKEELERLQVSPHAIIVEPMSRNTAAAIAVAALSVVRESPGATLVVMPSDQMINDEVRFVEHVKRAARVAATGRIVLFGIEPNEPRTGYGYIRRGAPIEGFGGGAWNVDAFFEKPDVMTAQSYFGEGGFYWNSGIIVLHARFFLDELGRFEPRILDAAEMALSGAEEDLGHLRLETTAYAASPTISIDRALLERTDLAAMLPIDVGWSDVGSWTALWEIAPHDADGNYVHAETVLNDTTSCYVHSERRLVATIGIKDLVIVDTPDALLVADKSRSQDVSKIVEDIKRLNRTEHAEHVRSYRPWGFFETLSVGHRFQVKHLHVKPGGKLSMQMHHHRSEHWIVVHGTAKVVIDGIERLVCENESAYIFSAQWHRLENPGKVPLDLIEVQIGTYLGEDDIIRTDDIYRRAVDETRGTD
ncbi:mannose-1-phosphate guanylyltransferase/mannose-6-phosphate isomerase [Hyphomicrobium sp.]|uniref:mannose-1-phosphate guanylyltransferase/mannose-6-phosphate isomerase n=1 Tax=Hyphomicrobium sp. TaxID=82 RepID=UPI002E2F9CBB|nr:mannose-1-phosphate guanylyltransferase/mannose-6-phosphate isomerase [Hyphomicrobium sp.]HEX2841343.1 mannose-1-phosphate guanylyltransferase/mannose-6-phosphate isomerase [Hyphomicrobium sp.]